MMMSLEHAHDGLSDAVMNFYNDMLRRGTREMTPREWAEEFRSWLDGYKFEREYKETLAFLSEHFPVAANANK